MPGIQLGSGVQRLRPEPQEELPAQENLLLAAAYVSDAQYNRNVPFQTSPQAIRLYCFYNHWTMRVATYIFICVDLSLALFEEPALFPLPFVATALAEVLCLAAFSARLVHFAKVTPQMVFWKDTKNICIMVTIVVTLIDLIIYGSLEAVHIHSIRWTRALRPVFLINFPESRQIRRAFRSIRNTLPDILYVFLLFLFSVLMFSLMALKLFGDRGLKTADGAPYFTNILEIAFELYVLVTTANNPDIMMPAYNVSWWYSLYFITYIIINTYIFMSVFLAVVYNNYRKHLKNEIRKLAYLKRHKMIQAFNILKVKVGTEFVVKEAAWKQLAKVVTPDISSSHLELLLRISDEGQQGIFVWAYDVIILINAICIALDEKHPFISYAEWLFLALYIIEILLKLYTYEPRAYLGRKQFWNWIFVWAYDVIILINAICIALDEKHPFISYAEWLFLALYIIEILLKLYTYEPRAYLGRKQFWNWFDVLIIIAALVATMANAAIQSGGFALVTHQAAKLYFILFHIVVVILIVKEDVQDWKLTGNIGTVDSTFSGNDGDNRGKALKGLYFRIASKKYRTVDALLQRMFESEIAPNDEGPSLEEILNFSPSDIYPKNPNFDNSA
ncbi:Two pore calcium channel protein 2 [Heterocephalus glaber]|uniref:Two pore calcium channel protein 2 n=1 Tax=Heterocephalus glaber TaxID=10181 RepID=G5APS6_HETGA|nr:Two pore calcium channel protein 2 [Heterocephalus glaber]